MQNLETLREQLPEWARDVRLNLQSVLTDGPLTVAQRWGIAVACAVATRNAPLKKAVLADAQAAVDANVIDDACAAAALMAQNNVYYRFRHLVGKEVYSQKPARLRMGRIARPATNKTDFELFCLAVSALNACEVCIQAHEKVALEGGLTDEQVHDAIRIAATLAAAAVALET